jgi:GntR family transcriptional regulator/MocR family aminotransferase
MRRHYGEKRAALAESLAPVADVARLQGLEAGLHAFLELDARIDPARVAERAHTNHRVIVSTLDSYYIGRPTRSGLLLGYGGLSQTEIERGGAVLAQIIQSERG